MAKKRNKKLNPRRIPIPKSMIDQDKILEDATKDDLYHAWLLVFCSLIESNYIDLKAIPKLTEHVNHYISGSCFYGDGKEKELERAEGLMGIPAPKDALRINQVKSQVELEAFKRKVTRIALHTALCVLCLGLDSTGQFSEDELRRLFFGVDLTIAEVEQGVTSFLDLEESLISYGIVVERESDDLHHVQLTSDAQSLHNCEE